MAAKIGLIAGACLALLAAGAATAHHSFGMFDMNKEVTLEGAVVVEYRWKNPHTHIVITVADGAKDPASAGTWDIESASIAIMTRQGWNKSSFKAGDKITVVIHPLRSGEKGGALVYAVDKSGRKLYHDTERKGEYSEGASGDGPTQ
ncbi:MAG TPA: DUF6152 family protein [Steroidobacteraceae bacterium]|nr:DUF6152 family protein [Steroidobacteraceae bacterium]